MLHLRSLQFPGAKPLTSRIAATVAGLWDRFSLGDPGLVRLILAARGTLSVALTTFASILVGRLIGAPPAEFAAGIVFSCMVPFMMQEPRWCQRQVSMLVLAVPALLVSALTSFLHSQRLAGEAFFLALLFACFLFQSHHRRVMALGLVGVVMTYIGLFLRLPPSTIPIQALSVLLAIPMTSLACFVILPLSPTRTLRRTVRAVQLSVVQVLHDAGPEPAARQRLQRSLARLNTVALAADGQLGLFEPQTREALRLALINLELATAQLLVALSQAPATGRHMRVLQWHARRLRHGQWFDAAVGAQSNDKIRRALHHISRAAGSLDAASIGIATQSTALAPSAVSPGGGPLAWRLAFRVTFACALAMAGGIALSENRWFWSVITTYLVFLGARSRGDTIYKGLQRVGGTILGILAGLLLAYLMTGDAIGEVAVILLSLFGMYYCITASYTLGIFCVTILLGLLYGMLGSPIEELLLLRLEETAIGAAAAIFVAAFVLPTRTREQVTQSGRAVLRALAGALRASHLNVASEPSDAPAAMRAVDREVADLRLALLPLTAGRFWVSRGGLEQPASALLDCVNWARAVTLGSPTGPADAARLGHIADHLASLAEATPGHDPTQARPLAPQLYVSPDPLDQLERAVHMLDERIAIGALAGFGLGR